ncbi:MAG: hypothetical protein AAGH19_08470 [Pseudomonadota bacterium]
MNLTKSLFDRAAFFFLGILLFSFWGFWVTYFRRPAGTVITLEHVHGVAMFAWVALMVSQATLIRVKQRKLHRTLGKLSYLLVPLIVVSTISLGHHKLLQREVSDAGIYVFGLQFLGLVPFMVFYGLAMLRRAQPDVHARWMVCTAITLLDPIFGRIIAINFLPVPLETGIINSMTFGAMAALTAGLALLDYRDSGRRDVFLPALLIMAIPQTLFLLFWQGSFWRGFAAWFAALPIS